MLPSISIVIPTLNSERTLGQCLTHIRNQDYPKNRIEIIIADAGSTDGTIGIAKKFKVDKILKNPLITGEAGKSVGVKAAKNEIIALIDSDNLITEKNWLKKMVAPFQDKEIVGSEPFYYTRRKQDSYVTRYCALIGANDPLCIYLGNYDRFSILTGKWTGADVEVEEEDNYLKISLSEKTIPTIGANGFLVRRKDLIKIGYSPYLFDIDVVYQLVKKGRNKFAKVDIGIVHLFAESWTGFAMKTWRRIRDYNKYRKLRKYPWLKLDMGKLSLFVLRTLLVLPLLLDVLQGYSRKPDPAWLFHPFACWLVLLIYSTGTVKNAVFGGSL